MRVALCLVLLAVGLSGCSPIMAASGNGGPDFTGLEPGVPRAEVDARLGKPISSVRREFGDVATYQYFTEDQPNYWRAGLWTVLDVGTLGLAELVLFRMEALQGAKHVVQVSYDINKRMIGMEHVISNAPLRHPEAYVLGDSSEDLAGQGKL
jgi:hypothetical protein